MRGLSLHDHESRALQSRGEVLLVRPLRIPPGYVWDERDDGTPWPRYMHWSCGDPEGSEWLGCPLGWPGEVRFVREAHTVDVPGCVEQSGVSYRADHIDPRGDGPAHPMRWRPANHMKQWMSRASIRIEAVTVKRLGEVSEEEAIACGFAEPFHFAADWKSRYRRRAPWDPERWVWVVRGVRVDA